MTCHPRDGFWFTFSDVQTVVGFLGAVFEHGLTGSRGAFSMPGEHYVSHDKISCRYYHTDQHDGESKSEMGEFGKLFNM